MVTACPSSSGRDLPGASRWGLRLDVLCGCALSSGPRAPVLTFLPAHQVILEVHLGR